MTQQAFGSINEQNVYSALLKLKIDFFYQFPLNGGAGVRGGQIIDFILWVPPQPIALYVQGVYWHRTARAIEDDLKQHAAEQAGFTVLEILESECETVEEAQNWFTKNVL